MRTIIERYLPLYEQAGGGTGGGTGGTGTGGTGGTGGSGTSGTSGESGGAFNADTFYQQHGVPDGMKGKSWEEASAKLYEGYKSTRDQLSQLAPPKEPKDYGFTADPKIAPFFKSGDDPLMNVARETAHKLGISDKHFGAFLNGVFTAGVDKGIIPPPFNPAAEIEAIGKMVAPGKSGADLKTAVEAALQEASAFAPAFADAAKFSPAAKSLLVSLADEAGGIELIRFLKDKSGEFGVKLGGEGQNAGGYSKADYDRDVADPRYSPRSEKYDKAWRESIDARARALFGA